MRKDLKCYRTYLYIELVLFSLAAVALALIPVMQRSFGDDNKTPGYICAAVFWAGLAGGAFIAGLIHAQLTRMRKKCISVISKREGINLNRHRLPGALFFGTKAFQIVIYSVFAVGAVLIVTDIIHRFMPDFIALPVLAITFLTFVFHCIFDGKNYRSYKCLDKSLKEGINNERKHK